MQNQPDKFLLEVLDVFLTVLTIAITLGYLWASWTFAPYLLNILTKLHIPSVFAQTPLHTLFELQAINIDSPIDIVSLEFIAQFCKRMLLFMPFSFIVILLIRYTLLNINKVGRFVKLSHKSSKAS